MKPLTILALSLLLIKQAVAQGEHYNILSAGIGTLFPGNPGRDVFQKFDYTETPVATNTPSTKTFTGSVNGSLPQIVTSIDILNLELIRKNHSLDMGIGISHDVSSRFGTYFKGGYRYIFYCNGFQLKPAIDLYYIFGAPRNMGSIDNKDKVINLFGHTANPQWTENSYDDDGGTETSTYNADHVDVQYQRNSFLAEPAIVLTTNARRLSVSLEAGWMFQLGQSSLLKFTQSDTPGHTGNHSIGSIHIGHNGSMGGPGIGISVGLNFGHHQSRSRGFVASTPAV